MDDRDDTTSGDGDTTATPDSDATPKRKRRFPAKTAIALVVIVLIGLPIFSMLQPGYYGRYPELRERMDNWRVSTHARIPCSGCHVDPGVRGFLTFTVKSIPAFYSQLIRGPHETNLLSVPDREACQKCHTSYRQVSANGDLFIPHKAHVEVLEINCAVCHQDLVHSANTKGYNSPEMIGCLKQCHDGTQATAECVKCHTRKEVPEGHRAKDWLEVHSTQVKTVDCGSCHAWSPDYCAECHAKRPASHVGNWKKAHQYAAEKSSDKRCPVCHDEKFCQDCHD